jgi:post-segregation antitoxin (ccd killing protein)
MAMTLISTVTVGSGGAASMDFTSIPATFTDLVIQYSVRDTNVSALVNTYMQFNADTANNYRNRWLLGSGAATASNFNSSTGAIYFYSNGSGTTANTFASHNIYIPNYSGSTGKSVSVDSVQENNGTTAHQMLTAGLWTGTAAITSIKFVFDTAAAQHSTASLYGIQKGSGGATVS